MPFDGQLYIGKKQRPKEMKKKMSISSIWKFKISVEWLEF